jgi:hypothetical protein
MVQRRLRVTVDTAWEWDAATGNSVLKVLIQVKGTRALEVEGVWFSFGKDAKKVAERPHELRRIPESRREVKDDKPLVVLIAEEDIHELSIDRMGHRMAPSHVQIRDTAGTVRAAARIRERSAA